MTTIDPNTPVALQAIQRPCGLVRWRSLPISRREAILQRQAGGDRKSSDYQATPTPPGSTAAPVNRARFHWYRTLGVTS